VEEIVKTVSEKAGINADQAKTAVTSVIDFIKGKLPGVGDQIQGLLEGKVEGGGIIDAARKKLGI